MKDIYRSTGVSLPSLLPGNNLTALEQSARDLIQRSAKSFSFTAGQRVFSQGQPARNFLIMKQGSVRVSVTTDSGREIVLYHVEPGQTCIWTTAGLLGEGEYEAEAHADSDGEAVTIPKAAFLQLMAESPVFRQFVFSSYGGRLHSLIALVQDISARHLDRKLARFLLQEAVEGIVMRTHQAIAIELNTSREVVTRLVQDFAQRGWLKPGRGQIAIRNAEALRNFAAAV